MDKAFLPILPPDLMTLIEQEVDQPLKPELLLLTRMGNCSKVASLFLLKAKATR